MRKMELGPNQKKLIAKLRSGVYKQGKFALCNDEKYCSLGIACELFAKNRDDYDRENVAYEGKMTAAPESVIAALALVDESGSRVDGDGSLVDLNDKQGLSFAEIADLLEANPECYFKNSI